MGDKATDILSQWIAQTLEYRDGLIREKEAAIIRAKDLEMKIDEIEDELADCRKAYDKLKYGTSH